MQTKNTSSQYEKEFNQYSCLKMKHAYLNDSDLHLSRELTIGAKQLRFGVVMKQSSHGK